MDAPHRRVVDLRRDGLADVPMLGMYSYSRARPICRCIATRAGGRSAFWSGATRSLKCSEQIYRLRGGDVFLTFPDEPHSTGGSPSEPGVLYWLNVRVPAARRRLLGLPRAEGDMLLAALADLPHRHFRATPPTKSLFKELFRWHDSPAAGPTRTLRLRWRSRGCCWRSWTLRAGGPNRRRRERISGDHPTDSRVIPNGISAGRSAPAMRACRCRTSKSDSRPKRACRRGSSSCATRSKRRNASCATRMPRSPTSPSIWASCLHSISPRCSSGSPGVSTSRYRGRAGLTTPSRRRSMDRVDVACAE